MSRRLPRALVPALLVPPLVLVLAPRADAGLGAAQTLAPTGSGVRVAADPSGNAAATWTVGGQVQVSQRLAGTPSWSAPVTLSAGEALTSATAPDVSVGPGGQVAVAWSATLPGGVQPEIRLAYRPANAAWVATRTITDNSQSDVDPAVEVGPNGVATVAWSAVTDTTAVVRSKTATATSASEVTNLYNGPGAVSGVALSRSSSGQTVAAWRLDSGGVTVMANRRVGAQGWGTGTAVSLGPASGPDAPSAGIDSAGNAVIAWSAETTGVATYSAWPAGGAPAAPVAAGTSAASQVQVAVNDAGASVLAWSQGDGLAAAQPGQPAALIAPGAVSSTVATALSATGAVSIGFAAPNGWSLAHRPVGGAYAVSVLGGAAGSTGAVAGHGSDATSAWSEGPLGAVVARTLDNGAPTAVHLTAPLDPFNRGTTVRAGWVGADSWSTLAYTVDRAVTSYAKKAAAPVPWQTFSGLGTTFKVKPGQTACLQVRATDAAGNVSATSVRRCTAAPVDDRTLKRGKGWKAKKQSGTFRSTLLTSSRKGATVTLPRVRAQRVALLVTTGKRDGSVTVRLGKRNLGTHSLASHRPGKQVVIPVASWSKTRTGKLTLTVAGSGKPVRIDGVYVYNP